MDVLFYVSLFIGITMLFCLNKLRIFNLSTKTLFHWLRWYALFLVVYYMISSNQFYLDDIQPRFLDAVNLGIVLVVCVMIIIYSDQYCRFQQQKKKLKEVEAIYAQVQVELNQMKNQNHAIKQDKKG